MDLFGLVAFGYMWCRMAEAAQRGVTGVDQGKFDFYRAKLTTARFFVQRLLPQTVTHLERIKSGPKSLMELAAEAF